MKKSKLIWVVIIPLLIMFLAVGLRVFSAFRQTIDHDETTYLITSNIYTNHIRNGEYTWLAWETKNYEHPPLTKIIYGISLLREAPLKMVLQSDLIDGYPVQTQQAVEYALNARMISVAFGSLAVLVLSIFNPLAGFFLAVNTLGIKYTSEIYLEALPMLTSLTAVIAYTRFFFFFTKTPQERKKAWLWLAVSAVGLGLTAASKYIYCVAGLAIVLQWIVSVFQKKLPGRSLSILLGWGIFSIIMFFLFDPYLWVHTFERLVNTLSYHIRFQASAHVVKANYPFWQPLAWLFYPFGHYNTIHDPAANDAFLLRIDTLIAILAVIGLPRTYKRQRVFVFWLAIGLGMLLVWGSKWAQYPLIILAPWCFSAAQGVFTLWDWFKSLILKKTIRQA